MQKYPAELQTLLTLAKSDNFRPFGLKNSPSLYNAYKKNINIGIKFVLTLIKQIVFELRNALCVKSFNHITHISKRFSP